ncbi:MAG: hypothetical protein ABFS35_17135 [Bacteroidota bacterium]
MKITKILLFTVSILLFVEVTAQETIKTLAAYKKAVDFNFSSEWQYLSTDLYLFNTSKFSYLINQIVTVNNAGKKKKKWQKETIQSIFIKAKIKDIKFFGSDMVYPIYNLKVSKDREYTTQVAANVEVIRLIDNLPLIGTQDFIDAELSGQIITQNNSNEFLKIVATQLQNISKYSKPNVAILDLIGEMGKFIESKTTGKQYKFSSTIRLYEDQDFNKRLHSVNIFVLLPSSMEKINVTTGNLTNYLNSAENPVVDQKKLRQLINFRRYPMIVIANYKSRYNSQPVIGDQINFEYIADRKLKVSNAYQSELINKDTYVQENMLISYLEMFARFKLNINNYKLNKQNKITDDFSKNIFVIMQDYNRLIDLKKQKENEYYNNPVFQNEFRAKYETVLNTANIYLEADPELKNIKDIMSVMVQKSTKSGLNPDSAKMESDLKTLHSIIFPQSEQQSSESQMVKKHIQKTERLLFTQNYLNEIRKLENIPTETENIKYRDNLIKQASLTNCILCQEKLNDALNIYTKKYNKHQKLKAITKNEEQKQKAVGLLFDLIKKKNCIEKNIEAIDQDSLPEYFSLFEMELTKFKSYLDQLNNIVRKDITDFSTPVIIEQNHDIETLIGKTNFSHQNLCTHLSNLCKCN